MKKIRGTFLSIPVLLLANAPALWKLIDINSLPAVVNGFGDSDSCGISS